MASAIKLEEGRYSPAIFSSRRSTVSIAPEGSMTDVSFRTPREEAGADKKFKHRKHRRWYRLRKRMSKKGVVPVNKDHPRFGLLSCIREGLRKFWVENPEVAPKKLLNQSDFDDVITTSVTYDGQEFEFESFATSAFATIRQAVSIAESEYMTSVAPGNLPYLEFMSNSKSGQDFFLSNDMQYMFKSNRRRDVIFFLSTLSKYMQHFISYPHSLLVKYIGCYAIKLKGKKKRFFLVMQSIFYPSDRIEDRFDVKGCIAGRYQKPNRPGSHIITVLKDQNFFNEELDLGSQSDWFIKQINADAAFLRSLNCMDYSLLVGRQKRHLSEKQTESVSTLVHRIGNSISPTRKGMARQHQLNFSASEAAIDLDSSLGAESEINSERLPRIQSAWDENVAGCSGDNHQSTNNNGSAIFVSSSSLERRPETSPTAELPGVVSEDVVSSSVIIPQVKAGIMFPRSLLDGVEKFEEERRRLLPKCSNGLHIIEGPEHRYFVGIVDFLTRFDWRQKSAQYWKMIKYGCGDHSTKNPDVYYRRFVDFLSKRVR
ncbi:phosphatidylinositol 4-phosphate 5-kinase-like protein 1 [Aplysia californica]|uniref:Phosphatidylinositol 4-phosphate 5-kinase-like protein 1 n=1 Tax=Aplysia californica TaxID=6500 RepID=A0ABM0K3G5_APLCA|nr:phosphatidylinositol 4-phosphate 5-kinase-like protein 1 [Aplysia californica]